jgi:saccharopine dehydrogenase-like NADP-dependent oxidoreductase
MRILIPGCGKIGSTIAQALSRSLPDAELTVADRNRAIAEETASRIGGGCPTGSLSRHIQEHFNIAALFHSCSCGDFINIHVEILDC